MAKNDVKHGQMEQSDMARWSSRTWPDGADGLALTDTASIDGHGLALTDTGTGYMDQRARAT